MILTTARLVLRDFVEDDWPAVLAYQNEPRLRDAEHFKGRYWDTLHYAILNHEWQARNP
jgi:RimJ/RimL family protein N-acetyltransferase